MDDCTYCQPDKSCELKLTTKKEPRCKMSVFIEEYDEEASYCALATLVKCEGLREDSKNCPYWRGAD